MIEIGAAGRDTLTAAQALAIGASARSGGVILFPTDTLYGLGVDPLSAAGLEALFRLKGREPGKPVPVLLADDGLVERFAASIPAPWRALMASCWPGPLTLLFPSRAGLPAQISSAWGRVALRVPGSPLCRAVLRAAGGCLTGTSANPAGAAGSGDPAAALRGIGRGVRVFVNGGTLPASHASTVLDMDASGRVSTLRAGAIPETDPRLAGVLRRPGGHPPNPPLARREAGAPGRLVPGPDGPASDRSSRGGGKGPRPGPDGGSGNPGSG